MDAVIVTGAAGALGHAVVEEFLAGGRTVVALDRPSERLDAMGERENVHAIGVAHNLGAAFIDNHLHHGNALGIDPLAVPWPRVVDISDRALRKVIVGLGGRENGYPRETEFVITVASEVMAVLALASSLADLRIRLHGWMQRIREEGFPEVPQEELFDLAGR